VIDRAQARRDVLLVPMLVYGAASLLHHVHNAVFLADYPNMPAWITPAHVCAAWVVVAAIGVVGFLLRRCGWRVAGLLAVGVYAAYGLDGLAHYGLAPVSAHTFAMNLTIWLEVGTALVLLMTVGRVAARELGSSRH
jgi:hypothetical protein